MQPTTAIALALFAACHSFAQQDRRGVDRDAIDRLVETQRGFGPAHDLAVQRAEEAYPTEPLNPNVVRARFAREGRAPFAREIEERAGRGAQVRFGWTRAETDIGGSFYERYGVSFFINYRPLQ